MDAKTLHTLEYAKILERLAGYCSFSASAEKARLLLPSNDLFEARRRQAETREAVRLLSGSRTCGCGESLRNTIMTPEKLMPAKTKKDLALIIGKYVKKK